MTEPTIFRLNLLRAGYLLLVLGLGPIVWPALFGDPADRALMSGVVLAMLGALSALAVLGLRHPLRLLPLLLFEIAWKTIWLSAVALPLWRAGRLDGDFAETAFECALVVLIIAVVPWRYVVERYVAGTAAPLGLRRRAVSAG